MRRIAIFLVYAALSAAPGYATPYSRISDEHTDIYNQHSDRISPVNDAVRAGQAFTNSFNGYAASASSSIPYHTDDLNSGYVNSGALEQQVTNVGNQQFADNVQSARADKDFWWMNSQNPFKSNGHASSGCNSNQCGSANGVVSVDVKKGIANEGSHGGGFSGHNRQSNVNFQGNPFFQGVGSSSVASTVNTNAAPTQFQQKFNTKFDNFGQKTEKAHGNNYFSQTAHHANVNTDSLSVSCSGHGQICIAKHLCVNGYVVDSVQGLTQIKSNNQQCDINNEVCCTINNNNRPPVADQVTAGSYQSSVSQRQLFVNSDASGQRNGGIFDNFNTQQEELDLNAGDQVQQNIELDENSNGYLPPIGSEPSSNIPAFSKPPKAEVPIETDQIPSPSGPAPTHIQLGCAAALICVEEQFCGMDGMISPTTLVLSSEQLIRRVPLSDCKNPDSGIIGKCCRDPNYVDPWPTGNLPANYTGGFDEQGFPTFLNIQRTRPAKKPTGQLIKTSFSAVKNTLSPSINQSPEQRTRYYPSTSPPPSTGFNRIEQGYFNVLGGKPFSSSSTVAPSTTLQFTGVRETSQTVNLPVSTNRPLQNYPKNVPIPFHKNTYDQSSSNTSPIVVPPYSNGIQCGVKNSVQRPNNLNDVDVGFGEIPWEAMVLSNREKKLLCSGAIIAPNVVLTAARCVYGFKPDEVSIKAGEWKLGYELKHEEPLPFEIIQVANIITHPNYQPGYSGHDLAMLMLEYPVKFDYHVGVICTRPSIVDPIELYGKKCISTGWGKHVLQAHLAGAIMHSIDIDAIDRDECQNRLSNAETQIQVDDSLICTKSHKVNNNMCQVDLGGPLACDRGDGIYEIVGVYNQDTGCLPTNQVATFAIVDEEWIKYTLTNLPNIALELNAPLESSPPINVLPFANERNEPCDCQKSVLPPENNQYLPPV